MINTHIVPTGNTTQAAHAFYNYLWAQYLGSIPAPRTHILWSGPIYVALFVIVLTAFFFIYTRYADHIHRTKGEMYGIMSFAGSILERIGPVSALEIFLWAVLFVWAVGYIVAQILQGYLYILPIH